MSTKPVLLFESEIRLMC